MKTREGPKGRGLAPAEQRGVVLVVTLLVITFLSLLGVAFLSLSLTENTISHNLVMASQAFGIAEAGLEHGRVELLGRNVNAILAGGGNLDFSGYGTTVSFAAGTYRVTIRNNTTAIGAFAADPGGATNDTDNQVLITATGTYRSARKVIEALVSTPKVPAVPAALALYGPDPSTKIQVRAGSSAELSGNNYDPPAAWPCSGASCDSPANGSVPAIAGTLTNSSQATIGGHISGNPASTTDLAATAAVWRTLAATLAPAADITLSGTQTIASNTVWGAPDQPVLVYLTGNATDSVTIAGNVNGAGILLIDSNVQITGTLNFQGIIIIMRNGTLEVQLTGDSTLYGAVIADCTSTNAAIKFNLSGNARLRYSQVAIDRALKGSKSQVLTWREVLT